MAVAPDGFSDVGRLDGVTRRLWAVRRWALQHRKNTQHITTHITSVLHFNTHKKNHKQNEPERHTDINTLCHTHTHRTTHIHACTNTHMCTNLDFYNNSIIYLHKDLSCENIRQRWCYIWKCSITLRINTEPQSWFASFIYIYGFTVFIWDYVVYLLITFLISAVNWSIVSGLN